MRTLRRVLLLAGLAAAAPALLLPRLTNPAPWIGGVWAVLCFAAMYGSITRRARLVWWNLGAAILIVTAAELWLSRTPNQGTDPRRVAIRTPSDALFVPDKNLGHRPRAGVRAHATVHYDDELVYDVDYTFNADGLRITPPEPPDDHRPCVLFFGCSFTFGEGVQDDESMPYRVGVKAREIFRVRNFGYSAYGPHQMLAAIETGLVEKATHCTPTHAIYMAIPTHLERVAGRYEWDRMGPRYVVGPDGQAIRNGNFNDVPAVVETEWGRKSKLVTTLVNRWLSASQQLPAQDPKEERRLLVSVIATARDRLQEIYPGLQFHVLWYDRGEDETLTEMERQLDTHRLGPLLRQLRDQGKQIQLNHDPHPTATAHDAVADYVVRNILRIEPAAEPTPDGSTG